jgi:hypothetical protein
MGRKRNSRIVSLGRGGGYLGWRVQGELLNTVRRSRESGVSGSVHIVEREMRGGLRLIFIDNEDWNFYLF